MELAKVIGTIVATQKYKGLEGIKLLIIEPIDHNFLPTKPAIVACDTVHAGIGDIVYWIAGREACLALAETFVPVDATIVGFVDEVTTK